MMGQRECCMGNTKYLIQIANVISKFEKRSHVPQSILEIESEHASCHVN